MQRVVSFYEKLPRGAAPETKGKGLVGRYQARYFGKKTSATRMNFPAGERFARILDQILLTLMRSHHPRPHLPHWRRLRSELLLPPAYVPRSILTSP